MKDLPGLSIELEFMEKQRIFLNKIKERFSDDVEISIVSWAKPINLPPSVFLFLSEFVKNCSHMEVEFLFYRKSRAMPLVLKEVFSPIRIFQMTEDQIGFESWFEKRTEEIAETMGKATYLGK